MFVCVVSPRVTLPRRSHYATVREHGGRCYLYTKTVERAHAPARLWEKMMLPQNYVSALELIDKELAYFPKFLQHKNKQRLTKIHQCVSVLSPSLLMLVALVLRYIKMWVWVSFVGGT